MYSCPLAGIFHENEMPSRQLSVAFAVALGAAVGTAFSFWAWLSSGLRSADHWLYLMIPYATMALSLQAAPLPRRVSRIKATVWLTAGSLVGFVASPRSSGSLAARLARLSSHPLSAFPPAAVAVGGCIAIFCLLLFCGSMTSKAKR